MLYSSLYFLLYIFIFFSLTRDYRTELRKKVFLKITGIVFYKLCVRMRRLGWVKGREMLKYVVIFIVLKPFDTKYASKMGDFPSSSLK